MREILIRMQILKSINLKRQPKYVHKKFIEIDKNIFVSLYFKMNIIIGFV